MKKLNNDFYKKLASKFEKLIEETAKEEDINGNDYPDFYEECINSIYDYIEASNLYVNEDTMLLIRALTKAKKKIKKANTTKNAMKVLKRSLTIDKEYYLSWRSNIAMSMYDAIKDKPIEELHENCNIGAKRFLNLLMDSEADKD